MSKSGFSGSMLHMPDRYPAHPVNSPGFVLEWPNETLFRPYNLDLVMI